MRIEDLEGRDLAELGIVDSEEDEGFDRLTKLASTLCDAPVALVSIVQEHLNRQFFTSAHGLPEPWATDRQTPLSHSFCQHVKSSGTPLIVSDARENPLLRDNLAIPDLNVIAYLGIPICGPDGNPIGALCAIDGKQRTWTDREIAHLTALSGAVSDQIKLRAALLSSESNQRQVSLFGRIVQRAHHEVYIFDAKTLFFSDVNLGAIDNLGFSMAELRKMSPIDIKPEYSEDQFRTKIAPLVSGAVSELQLDTVHQRHDGSKYPVEIRLERFEDANRVLLIAFCKDMTVPRQLEKEIRAKDLDFETIFLNSPDPMAIAEADTTIRMLNPAYETLTGQSSDVLVGQSFLDQIRETTRSAHWEKLQALTPENPMAISLKDEIIDDLRRSTLWTEVALFSDLGKREKFILFGRDVTELNQAKRLAETKVEEAHIADQAKAAFLANMSHEVRTPLNAMLGLFQLIEMSSMDEMIKTHATTGCAAGQAMVAQLNNVLDVSRIEARAVSLNAKDVPLGPLVEEWQAFAQGAVRRQNKDIDVCAFVNAQVPSHVCLDQDRTTQIIMNLCDNAAKFTQKGKIFISIDCVPIATSKHKHLEISVADTGRGIPMSERDHVFERFAQVDSSITRLHSGTGLGLSICRDLAHLMNGQLHVECPSSVGDYATRFVLSIPVNPVVRNGA